MALVASVHAKAIALIKLSIEMTTARRAYGVALQALGHANPRVVALDADVRNSTYSETFLHDAALQERFFECRIAEQNMLSCAGRARGLIHPHADVCPADPQIGAYPR